MSILTALTYAQYFSAHEGSVLNRNGKRAFSLDALKKGKKTMSNHMASNEQESSLEILKDSEIIYELVKILMKKIQIKLTAQLTNSNEDQNSSFSIDKIVSTN